MACNNCSGSGRCSSCKGSGSSNYSGHGRPEHKSCLLCYGSGVCQFCGGHDYSSNSSAFGDDVGFQAQMGASLAQAIMGVGMSAISYTFERPKHKQMEQKLKRLETAQSILQNKKLSDAEKQEKLGEILPDAYVLSLVSDARKTGGNIPPCFLALEKQIKMKQKNFFPDKNIDGKVITGVCSGLAERYGLDANLFRIAFILAFLFLMPVAIFTYFALWVMMPSPKEVEKWKE